MTVPLPYLVCTTDEDQRIISRLATACPCISLSVSPYLPKAPWLAINPEDKMTTKGASHPRLRDRDPHPVTVVDFSAMVSEHHNMSEAESDRPLFLRDAAWPRNLIFSLIQTPDKKQHFCITKCPRQKLEIKQPERTLNSSNTN